MLPPVKSSLRTYLVLALSLDYQREQVNDALLATDLLKSTTLRNHNSDELLY